MDKDNYISRWKMHPTTFTSTRHPVHVVSNPDGEVQVGNGTDSYHQFHTDHQIKDMNSLIQNSQIINNVDISVHQFTWVACNHCTKHYPLPVGARSFRCQGCQRFNGVGTGHGCAIL